jgi:hypothetical protein
MGASALPAFGDFARSAGQSGTGKHAVFAGNPSFAGIAQKCWDRFFNGSCANDPRVSDFNKNGALGRVYEAGSHFDRAQLISGSIIRAIEHKW